MAKPNHGTVVSAAAHEFQDARTEDGPRGIGPLVSEVARGNQPEPEPDFEDGVITVVKDNEGGTGTFETFAEALAFSDEGDTLQVGAGVYDEAFELDESVTIIGEEGAILDGSAIVASGTGFTSTIEVYDGFSGGSISGLEIIAVQEGSAFETIIGQEVDNFVLDGNTFDAGINTQGSLVYFNPGTTNVQVVENVFEGESLANSPFLGIEADNVLVQQNDFGEHAGPFAEVEIREGLDGTTDDVVLIGNTGLGEGDVVIV